LNALSLFSNIEVNPSPDETKEGGVLVEIKLHELNPKSVDVTTEWNFVPGPGGRPTLVMCLHIHNLFIFLTSVSKMLDKFMIKLVKLHHCNQALLLNLMYLYLIHASVF
jgi:hypothetical protein